MCPNTDPNQAPVQAQVQRDGPGKEGVKCKGISELSLCRRHRDEFHSMSISHWCILVCIVQAHHDHLYHIKGTEEIEVGC
jgi:hypothetical protein